MANVTLSYMASSLEFIHPQLIELAEGSVHFFSVYEWEFTQAAFRAQSYLPLSSKILILVWGNKNSEVDQIYHRTFEGNFRIVELSDPTKTLITVQVQPVQPWSAHGVLLAS